MTMKPTIAIIVFTACALAHAQSAPDATGSPTTPTVDNLRYSVRYSQSQYFYGSQAAEPDQTVSIASANLGYLRSNERSSFTLDYAGGYIRSISGPPVGDGVFQTFSVIQKITHGRWNLTGSDNFSDTPEAPVTGFSGIPGTGEPIATPSATPPSQTVLTLNTRSISNSATLRLDYPLSGSYSMNITGNSQLLRYPDGNGLESDGAVGSVGLTSRLSARSSLGAQYTYSRYHYAASLYTSELPGNFETDGFSVQYIHSWTRAFRTDISLGPEWITDRSSSLVLPTQTLAVTMAATYQSRANELYANYNRGISGGSGYLPGALVDTVTVGDSRTFARTLTVGAIAGYYRTVAFVATAGSSDARIGGLQASKQLGSFFSFFANYTAVDQSSDLSLGSNILKQHFQLASFGFAISPRQNRRDQ